MEILAKKIKITTDSGKSFDTLQKFCDYYDLEYSTIATARLRAEKEGKTEFKVTKHLIARF